VLKSNHHCTSHQEKAVKFTTGLYGNNNIYGQAPRCLINYYSPVSDIPTSQDLPSTSHHFFCYTASSTQHLLLLGLFGGRNSLPDYFCDLMIGRNSFSWALTFKLSILVLMFLLTGHMKNIMRNTCTAPCEENNAQCGRCKR